MFVDITNVYSFAPSVPFVQTVNLQRINAGIINIIIH